MSAAGGIGLRDTGDSSPATIHKCTVHKQKNKALTQFQNTPFLALGFEAVLQQKNPKTFKVNEK